MNNNLYRVGIYLRLSNEDTDKLDKHSCSESIKNQRNMLIDYIKKNPEFKLISEYCDEDLSGAGTYRPEFERLIKDCRDGKLDIVLCKSQSRFSRDMEIVERYINNKFKEWNIRFIGLVDNADTYVSGNKKARQINGLVNEWYLEDVSNNIRSAFNSKMKQGEFISPFASFGYEVSKIDNNKLVVDHVAAGVVKDIYNLYLQGLGYTKICEYLNSNHIPSPSLYKYQKGIKLNIVSNKDRNDIKWSVSAVKKILTNELYIGNLIQGKTTTVSYKNHKIRYKDKLEWVRCENTHEAIIDKSMFDKVQISIKERTKSVKKSGTVHIFSGKVFCLECSKCMRKKNSLKHSYLVCSNIYNTCDNKASIRYDILENIILEEINKTIKKYYDLSKIKKLDNKNNIYTEKIELLEEEYEKIQNEIYNSKRYLKNLYEDKVNGVITLEEFKSLIKNYNEDKYKKKIKDINCKIKYYKKIDKTLENKLDIYNKYKKIDKLNRVIIEEFIDKIYIGKKNNTTNSRDIKIMWKY